MAFDFISSSDKSRENMKACSFAVRIQTATINGKSRGRESDGEMMKWKAASVNGHWESRDFSAHIDDQSAHSALSRIRNPSNETD